MFIYFDFGSLIFKGSSPTRVPLIRTKFEIFKKVSKRMFRFFLNWKQIFPILFHMPYCEAPRKEEKKKHTYKTNEILNPQLAKRIKTFNTRSHSSFYS